MITVAKTAGFCFGVDRAVDMVYQLLEENHSVATLGPIIHNPQLVEDVLKKGARIIDSPTEANEKETVVIRSHGVGKWVYDILDEKQIPYKDATCPYVAKIQRIVCEQSLKGATVIIVGDPKHPEVIGICEHIVKNTEYFVVSNIQELENLGKILTKKQCDNLVMLAQTTLNANFWETCRKFTKKLYTNAKIFDTICSATSSRQSEVLELAKKNDIMIIIGGKESSNTKKLFELCQEHAKTYLIETYHELANIKLSKSDNIGISAGASTPAYIIEEALKTMSEILRNENEMEDCDFAKMLEETLEDQKIYNGKRVKGIVTSYNNSEVHVDIGAKQAGIIPASELTDDPTARVEDIVNKGDEIDLVVVKVNDQEGVVTLSKKRSDAAAGFDKIKTAYEEDAVLDGIITDVVRGGVLVYTCDTKIFVPQSQSSNSRVEDLNTLLKQKVKLKVIEINEQKLRAKGSVRAVLSAERKEQQAKFWETIEIGKQFKGEVKSLTAYGAFVDLGGIDGMIHITELSWSKIKHPSEVLTVGDVIEVYIKDLDKEKKRISLGYRNNSENPWEIFGDKYSVGDVVTAKLVSFTGYGAFAEIIPGVDGLIHISQIANQRVEKVGDVLNIGETVDVKIIEVDTDKKRISLSIRALLTNDNDNDE